LGNRPEHEFVPGSARSAQPKSVKPEDALEVCKSHLNAFAIAPRLFKGFSAE
jgi:hypothetical protein